VLVTSAAPGEGKTVVALSLARVAARSGRKVLLIDADFRRPAIAGLLKLPLGSKGLVEVLRGEAPIERCVVSDPMSGVGVLACTDKPSDPAELLTSAAFENLLVKLRTAYDFIVVDAAPLRPVHDTWSIARLVDTTLMVVRSGHTPRDVVVSALQTLRSVGARVAGVALTRGKADTRYGEYLSQSDAKFQSERRQAA
jgi:receptor protein-tyrosine kinase